MNVGKSVFAQLMSLVPWYEFGKCVDKYGGDYKVQKFTTRQQFLVKGAVKAHILLDFRGSIPTFIEITDGLFNDVNILDQLILEPGAFYVMDRAYIDFERLYRFNKCAAFFVTRGKSNLRFRRISAAVVDKTTGLRCDQTIRLTGFYSEQNYPDTLRRIRFYDEEQKRTFVFLTNNFEVPALTIAQLFKERWKIELFFKWIKQHLKIKAILW